MQTLKRSESDDYSQGKIGAAGLILTGVGGILVALASLDFTATEGFQGQLQALLDELFEYAAMVAAGLAAFGIRSRMDRRG